MPKSRKRKGKKHQPHNPKVHSTLKTYFRVFTKPQNDASQWPFTVDSVAVCKLKQGAIAVVLKTSDNKEIFIGLTGFANMWYDIPNITDTEYYVSGRNITKFINAGIDLNPLQKESNLSQVRNFYNKARKSNRIRFS